MSGNKTFLTALALGLSIVFASAQDITQLGGIYTPYPDKETAWTKAPAGYKPVYLAHFGRHGSRYHTEPARYEPLLAILEKAEFGGALNENGKNLLADVRKVAEEARGHYGTLVPCGVEEHRHIMQRFCRRYPEIFVYGAPEVEVYSSMIPRCLMSMAVSTDAIKEFNPRVKYTHYSNDEVQKQMFYGKLTVKAASNASSYIKKHCEQKADPQILIDKFFNDGGRYLMDTSRSKFGVYLQHFAAGAYETGVDIWKYFTYDELLPYWKRRNAEYYYKFGPSKEFSEVSKDQVRQLLLNMLNSADEALAGGKYRASLRYGHDTQIMPLADLLGIEGCCTAAAKGQAIDEVWRSYEITPMAANIQMLFFRKGKSGDVLVKVMHNEKEIHLEGIKTDIWPFYHWKDVRRVLYDRIEKLPSFQMNGWQRDTVSQGLVYMRYSGREDVTRSNQIISVAEVDLNNPRYSVDFTYNPETWVTSEAFKATGAVVTMNGSYEPESVVVKTEGQLRTNIPSDVVPFKGASPQWKSDCVICTDGRKVSIEYTGKGKTVQEMREAYAGMQWPEMFGSSPMLIEKGVPVGKYFATSNLSRGEINKLDYEDPLRHQGVRHPRCAVALTADNHLLLICVDGRRPGLAEGMTAWELTTFIESQFHPVDAINMDGGASASMCIKGRGDSETHLVNYPSKSKTYDRTHQRPLPTHIHILDSQAQ